MPDARLKPQSSHRVTTICNHKLESEVPSLVSPEHCFEEKMSGADSLLFKEENVPGKGVGCVAMKNIKKGTLVLRETPQLYFPEQKEGSSLDAYRENAEAVIEGFTRMSRDDQRKYLELCNNFEGDRGNLSPGMNIDFDAVMEATNDMTFPTLCKGKALKVWSIYKTNGFPNGVFLKMSRFNHSCRPNAE